MHIEQLHLEITRRCNLECEHCFRGDSQNINIKLETLKNVFTNVDKIDKLLITGGEPFLAINELEEMIDLIKKYNVKIEKINIVTNGTVLSSRVLKVLKALSQISNLELSISFDIFHLLQLEKKNLKEKRDKNVEFLKENFNTKEFGDEKKLKDESQYAKYQPLQPIGRAKNLKIERLNEINSLVLVKYIVHPVITWDHPTSKIDGNMIHGVTSIDVNGNIVSYSLSFEEEDLEALKSKANINNLSFKEALNNFLVSKKESEELDNLKYLEELNKFMNNKKIDNTETVLRKK